MDKASPSTALESPLSGWEIPIIDAKRRIVGWTLNAPKFAGGVVYHPHAESLVGGAVVCAYVQIDDPASAQRAGAPEFWQASWRCLGLCSTAAVARVSHGGDSGSVVIISEHD